MRFESVVELHGKTATGISVPDEVVTALGPSRRPAVTVSVRGHTYRSTVARMGGRFLLPLSAPNREAAGVSAGDRIEVDVELDHQPREVEIPLDFAEALAADAVIEQHFKSLSYTKQREHVLLIEGAKAQETRERRIRKAIDQLTEEVEQG